MKVCGKCCDEFDGKDGDNLCERCDGVVKDVFAAFNKRRKHNRRIRESVLSDLGMVKVKGVLGGTYWE